MRRKERVFTSSGEQKSKIFDLSAGHETASTVFRLYCHNCIAITTFGIVYTLVLRNQYD